MWRPSPVISVCYKHTSAFL